MLREWFATHGIPEQVVTDNGPQFVAEEFEIFVKRNGIKHVKSAPYHPASNGLAERFIKSLKQSLKASENDGRSLCQRLHSYLLSYRTTAHSTTGVPPCQLLMKRDLRTRLSLLRPNCEKSVLDKQTRQKSAHDRRCRHREWIAGDRVLVRNHRDGPDWIPGTIIEVLGPVTYIVQTDKGHKWKRHTDQIKDWLNSTPRVSSDTTLDSTSHNADPQMDFDDGISVPEDMEVVGTSSDPTVTVRVPVEDSQPPRVEPSSPTDPSSGPSISRYPTRVRQPPTRYDPSVTGTYLIVCN